jgi:hypothetical protein
MLLLLVLIRRHETLSMRQRNMPLATLRYQAWHQESTLLFNTYLTTAETQTLQHLN